MLTVIGAIPGGALRAFCVPLKQMSIRCLSTSKGTPARVATDDHEQCAELVGYFAIVVNALNDAGGGLAVREADELDSYLAGAKNVRRIDVRP